MEPSSLKHREPGSVSMGKPRLCLGASGCSKLCRSRTFASRYIGSEKDHSRKIFKIRSNRIHVYALFVLLVPLIGLGVPGGRDCVPLLSHQTGSSPDRGCFPLSVSLPPSPQTCEQGFWRSGGLAARCFLCLLLSEHGHKIRTLLSQRLAHSQPSGDVDSFTVWARHQESEDGGRAGEGGGADGSLVVFCWQVSAPPGHQLKPPSPSLTEALGPPPWASGLTGLSEKGWAWSQEVGTWLRQANQVSG